MRTKTLLAAFAATAIALTGCNKDDNQVDTWNGEIRLSSGVTTQTRAFDGMNTQLPNRRTVAVYVDNATPTQIYGNNVLTANGSGAFTGGTTMYFPEDKSAVSIYAFHTNATLAETFPSTITHAVSNDQSGEANYLNSDLLYAASKDNAFSKTAIGLTFYHMLAKVQVAIRSGAGTPDLTNATVSIVGTQLKADFTPNKAADINNAEPTVAQPARAGMIGVTANDNTAADITLSNAVTTGNNFASAVYNDAIIVPQTVAQDAPFIEVKLANGTSFTHKLAATTEFKSGKKYQYHITVNLTGLTVTSTIADWTPVGAIQGNAEMD